MGKLWPSMLLLLLRGYMLIVYREMVGVDKICIAYNNSSSWAWGIMWNSGRGNAGIWGSNRAIAKGHITRISFHTPSTLSTLYQVWSNSRRKITRRTNSGPQRKKAHIHIFLSNPLCGYHLSENFSIAIFSRSLALGPSSSPSSSLSVPWL